MLPIIFILAIFALVFLDQYLWKKGGCPPRETYDQGGFPDGGWDIEMWNGHWVAVHDATGNGRWTTEADAVEMARRFNGVK